MAPDDTERTATGALGADPVILAGFFSMASTAVSGMVDELERLRADPEQVRQVRLALDALADQFDREARW